MSTIELKIKELAGLAQDYNQHIDTRNATKLEAIEKLMLPSQRPSVVQYLFFENKSIEKC
jgi:hypothetical protein